ncbi:ATP-dependent helicase HrpB [Solimonas terrae]|uniref:ATP-dependent helicase HrpB n=1 Tax=Solimonas terrae TaxID=1396819 RepID=A0A6M2BT36_9GAMM|nr:ATP-dependent helicase HrpB [Solimonas terrae]NGY05500.1 ATP-dependent helicase HrpB [Solimonas terrae]
MRPPLPPLPVLESVRAIREALAGKGCAVLSAPPGSGKTTLVPLTLLDEPWLAGKTIIMLEPRRVAARAAARRMASLLGEGVGETVGYQIRFERRISNGTRIEVITEGLLTRRLQADAELPGVGLVVFDEFHERSLDTDLALALTLDMRATLRPELRVLVMSATLDTDRVRMLLDDAPLIESGGRLFPVDIRYGSSAASSNAHGEAVAAGALRAFAETGKDILCFLPGAREIRTAHGRLAERLSGQAVIRPLYGELASDEQDLALRPDADGRRKIILATNIAQTSLTVEGVDTVVDGGLVRVARFDLSAGANRLETLNVSRASADQRAGRAGRLGPGVCYRLWTRDQHTGLQAHDQAEMGSVDLSRFALELFAWGAPRPDVLRFLDQPTPAHWRYAVDLLLEIGAVSPDARITEHGRALLRLPAIPRIAHMLLTAKDAGIGNTAAWTAAALEERDASGRRDLAEFMRQLAQGRADAAQVRRAAESARQFLRAAEMGTAGGLSPEDVDVARCVAWAYPERIAMRRDGLRERQETAFLCADGVEARIDERDPAAVSEWLAIAHWDPGPPRRIRSAIALTRDEVLRDQHHRLQWQDVVRWSDKDEMVVAEQQRRLGAIVVERRPLSIHQAGPAITAAMLEGLRSIGIQALPWTGAARQLQARVESLRQWRRDEDWPDFSDEGLWQSLDLWLAPSLAGISRRDHLSRLDVAALLDAQLTYDQQQRLNKLAPTHLVAPTGSRIQLEYRPPEPPNLAVKLQEMFGCQETPTINAGRTKVVLHLLSPAQRPLAITQDLGGFWQNSYADVRKDLRGRYPRHPWPEDPATAVPSRRVKPRGQ